MLHRRSSAPRCEEPGGGPEVQVRQEQSLPSIRSKALQRAVRTRNRRRGPRAIARAVHGGEEAGVLRRTTQDCLLMERVRRVRERGRAITAGLGDVRVRMKHDLCASAYGPSHRLRIPPPFVADHDAEGHRAGGEHPALGGERRVDGFFGRVDLPLVLPPATLPSGLMTHAVICKPRSVTRSVPRMTVIPAVLAASATSAHARSRNAGSGGGAVRPGHRYPGTKHSGKQTTSAPFRPASATADVASSTDSCGVAGTRRFASAMRTVLMPVGPRGVAACPCSVVSWQLP